MMPSAESTRGARGVTTGYTSEQPGTVRDLGADLWPTGAWAPPLW